MYSSTFPKRNNSTLTYKYSIFFSVIYRIGLDILYVNYISTIFQYTGFSYAFSWGRYILSWIIFSPILFFIYKYIKSDRFSDIIILFLIFLSFIPFSTMVAFYDGFDISFIFANVFYWGFLLLFMNLLPNFKIPLLKTTMLNDLILMAITGLMGGVICFISYKYTGFHFTISLENVYTLRDAAREFSMPILLRYLFAASKAINPLLLLYGLTKKRYIYSACIVLMQILSFSINGSKTVFFSTLLSIILFYAYKKKYLSKIPLLFAGITSASILETGIYDTIYILGYCIRRVFFLPNQLSWYYFDFFTHHVPDYFRQGFLKWFGVSSPYMDIDHLIGMVYYGHADMGANNGLISDAFTNLGWLGIVIMPLVLTCFLKILNAFSRGIDPRICVISAMTISFILVSSFFMTSLFTHGIFAICFVLYLLPRTAKK